MEKIKKILCKLQDKQDSLDMTALFRLMIKEGIKISAAEINTDWFEIDTPNDLDIADKLYNSGNLKIS